MKKSVPVERVQGKFSASISKEKEKVVAAGLRDEDNAYESEELWDVPVSDDEGDPSLTKYPLHKNLKNMKDKRGVWFSTCDSHRYKAVCQEGCKWFAYCHKMKREDTWQLTSCYKKYTCSKATKIGILSSQWLSKAFMKKIYENPKIKLRSLMRKTHSKWNVDLTKTKAARVKQLALDEINDVKNFVNKYYKKETYVNCYQHVIYPVNGPNLWDWTQNDDVLLPVFRKPIGRPKLSRNKAGDEPRNNGPLSKLSRAGQQQNAPTVLHLVTTKEPVLENHNAAPQAKKNAGTTRTTNSIKIAAKATAKAATKIQSKRKSNTQGVGTQQSQTSSKRAKYNSNANQSQPSTTTVTSPSRRILKYMAKTLHRAWKAFG
ncbi:hypothetical protein Ahy_A07g034101 [Arachis hypogaea]|uniref:Transposase MuDR plant domain-containing protein n=1 Tax=Arachis hypogaea TaxID=3818 RepID=A0A445CB77_ARAHY|nr:hypothetical protein Ahy_A07g034101 [Arachis hypogaea]